MTTHHVVVVGAGFGGLEFTRALSGAPVRITIIDRRNHHLFQPLLYQVATTSLATSEIAWPVRHLLRKRKDVTTLLDTVTGIDPAGKRVLLKDGGSVSYDTLVLATGARHSYFGHDEWEPFAPGLKTLEDATTIRRRILLAFEKAERETDPDRRRALMTLVIIGGGPTGVELAGTIAELARDTLAGEFRNIDTSTARVVLIEAGERVLPAFKPELSAYAKKALERLGVTVELGRPVSECNARRRGVWRRAAAGRDDHLGGRRRCLAGSRVAWRRGRSRRPDHGRAGPDRARPSRHFCHRRHRSCGAPGGRARARHSAGREARGQARRCNRAGPALRATRRRGPSVTSMTATWRRSASAPLRSISAGSGSPGGWPGGCGASPTSIS